ncbi:hypothetical protein ACFLQR_02425 [Verrucomicrobiota bacterium]
MRYPKGKTYLSSEAEFEQYRKQLKFLACPHCGETGFLICHGFLRGYGQSGHEKIIRGRRFFCSSRHRRKGCGRTFSILFSGFLRHHMVSANILWKFLQGVRRGLSRHAAWEQVGSPFSIETGYRLWKELKRQQSSIRSRLSRYTLPPAVDSDEPVFYMLEHLRSLFPEAPCPIIAFHVQFQCSFLR